MIKIKRGFDVPISGKPVQQVSQPVAVRSVALVGADYLGMKPSMRVVEGEEVRLGQTLFVDKAYPEIQFTAPATGRVRAINRGAKRVFQSIVIDVAEQPDTGISFAAHDRAALSQLSAETVEQQLLASGLWTALRTRPFSKLPAPGSRPVALFVNAMDTNPLAADPDPLIAARQQDFLDGLTVLRQLCPVVHVSASPRAHWQAGPANVTVFEGPHPAGLVGTHIHFLAPVNAQKTVWHINYQDVFAIGRLFTTGLIDNQRVIAFGGPVVRLPRLLSLPLGASLADVVSGGLQPGQNRVISGSVLNGRTAQGPEAYLGRYHLQIAALAEGLERELMHYFRPGTHRSSFLNLYAGKFLGKLFDMTTSTNGSERAMVPVGTYEAVMPLDVLPTHLLRAISVGDTQAAQDLGALELDEEDLALCTYTCPGKYEFGPLLRDLLTTIDKEG